MLNKRIATSSSVIGIGVDPNDETVTAPSLVKNKAEFYKSYYINNGFWKVSNNKNTDLLAQGPTLFPLYDPMLTKEARKISTKEHLKDIDKFKQKEAAAKIKAMEQAELDRIAKKEMIAIRKQISLYKKQRNKEWLKKIMRERKMAVNNDKNALKPEGEEGEVTKIVKRRVIKPITVEKKVVPIRTFAPYFISIIPQEREQESPKKENPMTMLFKLEDHDITEEGLNKINIPELLNELSLPLDDDETELPPITTDTDVNYTLDNLRRKQVRELIVLLPKAYTYGDAAPREIKYGEYTEHFNCYRMDPNRVIVYLKDRLSNGTKELTIAELRSMLQVVGLPMKTEAERVKYLNLLQKEEKRSTKLKEEKQRQHNVMKAKKNKKEQDTEERLNEINKEDLEKASKILEKHKSADIKVREMNDSKIEKVNQKVHSQLNKSKLQDLPKTEENLTSQESNEQSSKFSPETRNQTIIHKLSKTSKVSKKDEEEEKLLESQTIAEEIVDELITNVFSGGDKSSFYVTKEPVPEQSQSKSFGKKYSTSIPASDGHTSFSIIKDSDSIKAEENAVAKQESQDSLQLNDSKGSGTNSKRRVIAGKHQNSTTMPEDDSETNLVHQTSQKEIEPKSKRGNRSARKEGDITKKKGTANKAEAALKSETLKSNQIKSESVNEKDKEKLKDKSKKSQKAKKSSRVKKDKTQRKKDTSEKNGSPTIEQAKDTNDDADELNEEKNIKVGDGNNELILVLSEVNPGKTTTVKDQEELNEIMKIAYGSVNPPLEPVDEVADGDFNLNSPHGNNTKPMETSNKEQAKNDDAEARIKGFKKRMPRKSQAETKSEKRKPGRRESSSANISPAHKPKKSRTSLTKVIPVARTEEISPHKNEPQNLHEENNKLLMSLAVSDAQSLQSDSNSNQVSAHTNVGIKKSSTSLPRTDVAKIIERRSTLSRSSSKDFQQNAKIELAKGVINQEQNAEQHKEEPTYTINFEGDEEQKPADDTAQNKQSHPETGPKPKKRTSMEMLEKIKQLKSIEKSKSTTNRQKDSKEDHVLNTITSEKDKDKYADMDEEMLRNLLQKSNNHTQNKKEISKEDEKLIEEAYEFAERKLKELEDEKLKEEQEKAKKEGKEGSEDSNSSCYSEGDDDFITEVMSSEIRSEHLRRRLANPRRMAIMVDNFKNNEDIRNIALQRSEEDLKTFEGCKTAMNSFLEGNYPRFAKSNLKLAKFTPEVDARDDTNERPDAREAGIKRQKTLMGLAGINFKANLKGKELQFNTEEQGKIATQDIFGKDVKGDKMENFLLQQKADVYLEMLQGNGNKPITLDEKIGILKTYMLISARIFKSRRKEIDELVLENADSTSPQAKHPVKNKSGTILSNSNFSRFLETGLSNYQEVTSGEGVVHSNKKFKVNMTLLDKRKSMSKAELLERRYRLITANNALI